MSRRRVPFAWAFPAVVIVVGVVIGVAVATGTALLVFGVAAVLAHVWFVTWGPRAEPNRFHRRDLWENRRRMHREVRRHRRELRDRLAGH
jgi:hypothetical protein